VLARVSQEETPDLLVVDLTVEREEPAEARGGSDVIDAGMFRDVRHSLYRTVVEHPRHGSGKRRLCVPVI